jgi:predicted transposase YbfD/YdcC
MASLITILRDVPDPRRGNAQRHELLDILTIALVASVCGAESCVDFAQFAEDREPLLREFLRLENGLPSHDTFSRVFRLLDPAAFGRAFEAFLTDLGADGAGVLAIDGKTLRRSFDRAAGRSALHVVTAFGADARLSVGSRAVAPGENEITAARALLATLALDGALVTGDAVHAQAETAQTVLDRGGDYLFALKANRPAMLREVAAFFADPPEPLEACLTTDADHGRIETRRHRVTHCVDWLFGDRAEPDVPRMPGLATLTCVQATRDDGPTATRYYLSSARLSPKAFARAVRSHWAIENSLHWVLDVTFDEDAARNRADHGPENLAILRRLTLNLLRTARPKLPVSRKRKRSGWSDAFARSIIGQMR